MMTMPRDVLQRRAASHLWYHSVPLRYGIVTPGVNATARARSRVGLPERLDGLSVLDVGAWDGCYSFEAARRGAARVVASDSFAWHGEGWGTKEGFELCREALDSRVEDADIDIEDLRPVPSAPSTSSCCSECCITCKTRSPPSSGSPRRAPAGSSSRRRSHCLGCPFPPRGSSLAESSTTTTRAGTPTTRPH